MPSLIINAANRAKLLLPKLANVRQTLIQNIDILFSSVILLGIGPRLQLIIDASLSQRRSTLYESAYGDYMIVDSGIMDEYFSVFALPYLV